MTLALAMARPPAPGPARQVIEARTLAGDELVVVTGGGPGIEAGVERKGGLQALMPKEFLHYDELTRIVPEVDGRAQMTELVR